MTYTIIRTYELDPKLVKTYLEELAFSKDDFLELLDEYDEDEIEWVDVTSTSFLNEN